MKPPAPVTQMVWEEGGNDSAEGMVVMMMTTLSVGNGRESRRKRREN